MKTPTIRAGYEARTRDPQLGNLRETSANAEKADGAAEAIPSASREAIDVLRALRGLLVAARAEALSDDYYASAACRVEWHRLSPWVRDAVRALIDEVQP